MALQGGSGDAAALARFSGATASARCASNGGGGRLVTASIAHPASGLKPSKRRAGGCSYLFVKRSE